MAVDAFRGRKLEAPEASDWSTGEDGYECLRGELSVGAPGFEEPAGESEKGRKAYHGGDPAYRCTSGDHQWDLQRPGRKDAPVEGYDRELGDTNRQGVGDLKGI